MAVGTANKPAASDEHCNAELDALGDHAVTCEKGPWRVGWHEVVAETVASACRHAGGTALREMPIPELAMQTDAVLDIVSEGSAWVSDTITDITVRHPCAGRYMPKAAEEDGYAAAKAEEEKQVAYPPRGGRYVTAFAVETVTVTVTVKDPQKKSGVQPHCPTCTGTDWKNHSKRGLHLPCRLSGTRLQIKMRKTKTRICHQQPSRN